MQYEEIWKKILNPTEVVKYEFSVGDQYRKFGLILGLIFVGLLFLLGTVSSFFVFCAIILALIVIIRYQYLKIANAYAFTDRRILIHHGWLSTTATSVDYNKITEISITEPFLSRIFTESGDMSIHTSNITDALILNDIATPYEVKKKLDTLRHSL